LGLWIEVITAVTGRGLARLGQQKGRRPCGSGAREVRRCGGCSV
jgi:hypothetical protein